MASVILSEMVLARSRTLYAKGSGGGEGCERTSFVLRTPNNADTKTPKDNNKMNPNPNP